MGCVHCSAVVPSWGSFLFRNLAELACSAPALASTPANPLLLLCLLRLPPFPFIPVLVSCVASGNQIGVLLADGRNGPFRFEVQYIKVVRELEEADGHDPAGVRPERPRHHVEQLARRSSDENL